MRHYLPIFIVALAVLTVSAEARPVILPDSQLIKLDDIGLYEVGYAYRGQNEQYMPEGWTGLFPDDTGIGCQSAGMQSGKQAWLMHCPWRNGTGITFQQFTFKLPKIRKILLRGSTAIRSDIITKSDGVTFRIFLGTKKVLDENRTDAVWKPFNIDLSSYAGQTLTIRFEVDPGPKNDSSFDFSLWGERELVLPGYCKTKTKHPSPPALDIKKLWSTQTNGTVPRSGFAGKSSARLTNNVAIFQYNGPDGAMRYAWNLPTPANNGIFGKIVLHAQMANDKPIEVPLAQSAQISWTSDATPLTSEWTQTSDGIICTRKFVVDGQTVTLRERGRIIGKSLVMDLDCDKPVIKSMDSGAFGAAIMRKTVTVPYYSGQVFYYPVENIFTNVFFDYTSSASSAQYGTNASYNALTDGSRNLFHERVIYSAAWHVDEVLPNVPNTPSPYLKQVGGRTVLDIWGGKYVDIAANLKELADYGIKNCNVIIHDWQRSGYDNALPMHIPAESKKGGEEGMKELVETAKQLGHYIALHENYADYYPNYDFFDERDISLNSEGKHVNAWYNPDTKIQSFGVKPTAMARLSATQSPEIHTRYKSNACYLDVHSAVPPWFHVDFQAGESGAGEFSAVWNAHKNLWQFERDTFNGPVFGEGNNHWYWSGLLDGVEAQFGTGVSGNQGMIAPLAVDFDLTKIHPLQCNHGMGYYERWWNQPTWGTLPPMVVLDQYRMQEVAYGHAGFLGGNLWMMKGAAWQEHHLLSPVSSHYATAKPTRIEYNVNGKWSDSTTAAKANDYQRVRVHYNNGLTVTANSAEKPMIVGKCALPQFGWCAEGAGVMAYTALIDGVVADYAATSDSIFANARNASFWQGPGACCATPELSSFSQTAQRTFKIAYRWQVKSTAKKNDVSCVHFVDEKTDSIIFQQDHTLPKSTLKWVSGETIEDGLYTIRVPDSVADGNYKVLIGLYSTEDASREPLDGVGTGDGRISLGILSIRDGGKTIEFAPEKTNKGIVSELYSRNLNLHNKVVNFGSIRTNGSVLIRREGSDWVHQTMPRDKSFEVYLNDQILPTPKTVRCVGGSNKDQKPDDKSGWWQLRLNGASEYRWPAAK